MPPYRGLKLKVWSYPSHSTPGKDYETIQWANGELTCNCRGWIYPKNGNPRTCTHVQRVEAQLRESARADMRRKPPIRKESNYDAIRGRDRKQMYEQDKEFKVEFEKNFLKPIEPFKKYKRLIRVDTEA